MDFLPPCDSAASHYRVGLVSFGSGCVLVFQGGVFECSSRMKGNFQVRFLEGRVPAMAPGYSTTMWDLLPEHQHHFRVARNPSRADATRGHHSLQADLSR